MVKKLATYTIIKPNKPDSHLSGGFAAIDSFVKIIEELGYQNIYISPADTWQDPSEFDLVVYADIFNDPQGSPWFTNEQYGAFINSNTKSIVMECAYTGCTTEPYGIGGRLGGSSYPKSMVSDYMLELMKRSAASVFLSPLHRREFEAFLGESLSNAIYFYQTIDTSIFYNKNIDRDIPFLFVGALNIFKGLDDAINMFADKGLHVVGRGHPSLVFPKGVKYLGDLTPVQLADIYNRTETFVHVPRWQEPFARTVVEAALCGCNLILNENVGATSFGEDIRDPKTSEVLREKLKKQLELMVS